jgi:septum site-determining protein MinD
VTLNNPASAPARAYTEAAKRLSGEEISMTVPSKPNLLTKLFGRRAA